MPDPLPWYLDGLELYYTAPNGNEIWLPADDEDDGPDVAMLAAAIVLANFGDEVEA